MRLTLINQFYPPDLAPTGHLAASLAEHRSTKGDQVTVITSRGGYVPESNLAQGQLPSSGPTVIRLWSPGLGKSSFGKRLLDYGSFYLLSAIRLASLPRQDVVLSLTTPPFIAWAGQVHVRIHPGTKLALWNMDCYPEVLERAGVLDRQGLWSRLLRSLNRAIFRRIDHLICLDSAMAEVLLSQYADPARTLPSSVVPNWERLSQFPATLEPPPWPEGKALGLGDKFIILYLGNAGYGHRFETVIEAADRLRDEEIAFLFVGGGAAWTWLEKAKSEMRLENLILHRYVSKAETPSVMSGASCALITLRDEFAGVISPSKLHANLAMGLPVLYIGPEGTNVDEAIESFGCGASLRHGNVDGVVNFVRGLKADPGLKARLSRRARLAFEAAYSDAVTLPQFDRILDGLAGLQE